MQVVRSDNWGSENDGLPASSADTTNATIMMNCTQLPCATSEALSESDS